MARKSGLNGSLTLGVVKLGATNITWTPTRNTPDATGMDSGGAIQTVDGNIGATFSMTAHMDDAAGGLPMSVRTGGITAFTIDVDGGPTQRYTGNCRLTSCPVTVEQAGTVTYSVEAIVEGDWTEAP